MPKNYDSKRGEFPTTPGYYWWRYEEHGKFTEGEVAYVGPSPSKVGMHVMLCSMMIPIEKFIRSEWVGPMTNPWL